MNAPAEFDFRYVSLLAAANASTKVASLTHQFYRYPARFGEVFVREAILNFSRAGDTVLDPFCGGGTSVVEALCLGRRAIGNDLSKLAVAVSKAKTTPLSDAQLRNIEGWLEETTVKTGKLLLIHGDADDERLNGVPGNHQNLIARLKAEVRKLPLGASQDFARCLLLKTSQWAFDGKEILPTPSRFVARLRESFADMKIGMRSYTARLAEQGLSKSAVRQRRVLTSVPADRLTASKLRVGAGGVSLVVTSPPYLGVHVLYNRWQLKGRRELKVPFFIADCNDLGGATKYTIIGRSSKSHDHYYKTISASFQAVGRMLEPGAYVIQLVSFADSERSLPKYLSALNESGLQLCETYIHTAGELSWRSVPGRRWYARVGAVADSSAAQEVLLVHRRGPK